jgi:phage shock protein PspC (stress-responsive transcriptional regulator)
MKKTLNINIGNSIIHIEENAFELLTNYLIEVKQHFGKSADDFEIVSDIENRIAEMFTEMLQTQQKQVVELADVEVVIAMMGSVKDFEHADDEPASAYNETYTASGNERKIYRDTDEAMVAGVCAGLSHYLRMDVSILRLIAVMTVFLGGSGIIAYLILWVAIPKAYSRAEKMAMKGEAVNLQGFKRNFEEELSNLNDQMRPFVKQSRGFIAEFVEVLGVFLKGTGRTIFKFIAVIIVIVGSLMFLSALIAVAAILGVWDASTTQLFPFSMVDASYFTPFIFAVFIVVAIPMLALVLFSIRVAFNTHTSNKILSYLLLLVWLCGLSVSIFYVAKISSEFKEEARFTQAIPVKTYPAYHLSIDKARFFSKEDSLRYQLNSADYAGKIIQNNHDGPFNMPRNVSLRIERSEAGVPSITETYIAKGINFETALYHAKNIHYDFMQKDSLLRFSPELHLLKNVNWRDQHIDILLKLPVGTRLAIDRDLDRYIRNYSLWDCGNHDGGNEDAAYQLVMTDEGLKCKDEL